ncbi:hypothetical protein V6N13_098322 [Hibiscus sabdariffa]
MDFFLRRRKSNIDFLLAFHSLLTVSYSRMTNGLLSQKKKKSYCFSVGIPFSTDCSKSSRNDTSLLIVDEVSDYNWIVCELFC